jgi:hypothetical protein
LPQAPASGPSQPPAAQPGIDEAGIGGEALGGIEPELLGHAQPEPFDHAIGLGDNRQRLFAPGNGSEVERDFGSAPVEPRRDDAAVRPGTADPHHVRAHVRQQHARQRYCSGRIELHDPHSGQRAMSNFHKRPPTTSESEHSRHSPF